MIGVPQHLVGSPRLINAGNICSQYPLVQCKESNLVTLGRILETVDKNKEMGTGSRIISLTESARKGRFSSKAEGNVCTESVHIRTRVITRYF